MRHPLGKCHTNMCHYEVIDKFSTWGNIDNEQLSINNGATMADATYQANIVQSWLRRTRMNEC